jgi:hypothetical protein
MQGLFGGNRDGVHTPGISLEVAHRPPKMDIKKGGTAPDFTLNPPHKNNRELSPFFDFG